MKDDLYSTSPWRAPGTAPVRSPCGSLGYNHGGLYGQDGRDIPSTARAAWKAGEVEEVSFALMANHGGGYIYRVCPADSEQSEACII